jgi:uncharacterized membrane protein YbhN (UPF0104 family)
MAQARHSELRRWVYPAVATLAISAATVLLYRTLSQYTLDELIAATRSVPMSRIMMCGLFASLSYLTLTGFDWLALRHVGRPLHYGYVARASFCSLSLGHNIGFAALSSGAIRYRFYSRKRVPLPDIANVIVFCGVAVGLGLATLGGLALVINSERGEALMGISRDVLMAFGILCLAGSAGYVALAAVVRTELRIRQWRFRMPRLSFALGQVVLGTTNYVFVAACLHQAIAAIAETHYLFVAAVYVIANATSLVSHVPGGLGVLEAIVLQFMPQGQVLGALLIFRLTYYLVPLVLGSLLFAASELAPYLKHRRPRCGRGRGCVV